MPLARRAMLPQASEDSERAGELLELAYQAFESRVSFARAVRRLLGIEEPAYREASEDHAAASTTPAPGDQASPALWRYLQRTRTGYARCVRLFTRTAEGRGNGEAMTEPVEQAAQPRGSLRVGLRSSFRG